jgi:uncharacterized protein (TIRG00374 family)
MKKTWVRVALVLLLTAVLLFFFVKSVKDWGEVWRFLTHANLGIFVLVLLLAPLHLVTRAYRWKYLLIHEKKDVRFYNLFAGNAIGFTVTFLLPGRLGEIVKPLYVARKEGVRAGFTMGTVIVERIFDMFTMCSLLGVFLLARPLYESKLQLEADTYSKLYLWGIVGLALASLLLAVSLFFYFFREKALAITARLMKPLPEKLSQRILKLLHEFIDGLKFFHSLGNLMTYLGLSFVVWLGIMFWYWVFFQAYRVSLPYFFLIPYIFLTMIGASIPTPGMVGGFHSFSQLGLTALFKIDPNQAFGLTVAVHAVQLVMTCLVGFGILWKEGLTLFQLKKLGESGES